MNKSLKTGDGNGKNPVNFYFKTKKEKLDAEKYSDKNADWQDFSNESLRLKKLLKRAVEKEFAPQKLIDSIRSEIRR